MRVIIPLKMTDAILTNSNVPEDDFPEWNSSVSYTTGQKVIVLSTHRIYEALQNNTNVNPVTDTAETWLDIGPTNRWSVFDGAIESQTTQFQTVEYEFTSDGTYSGIALLNMEASQVTVDILDSIEGAQPTLTFSLVDNSNVFDWFSYFFFPILSKKDLIVSNLPIFANSVITINVTALETVKIGEIIIGEDLILGKSLLGGRLGIEDFSTKQKDVFGRTFIFERAFANTVDFQFSFPISSARRVSLVLAELRARPAVYYTEPSLIEYGANVYGFPRDFRINLETSNVAFATLEIEGLT
jgi:hypothetical protein